MSLDIRFTKKKLCPNCFRILNDGEEVFCKNITHNLGKMASEAGFYRQLWGPEETDVVTAEQLGHHIENGIGELKSNPEKYKQFSAPNGWGTYEQFLPWLEELLTADYYLEWSTVVDAPVTYGMSMGEFEDYYKSAYGNEGMIGLPERMIRVEKKGTSSIIDDNLHTLIRGNKAGDDESELTYEELIDRYCTHWYKDGIDLKEHPDLVAEAGLQGDWAYTGGEIFRDGEPDMDSYTYLSSNWAAPTLILSWDGQEQEEMECIAIDGHRFDEKSKWDETSLAILGQTE